MSLSPKSFWFTSKILWKSHFIQNIIHINPVHRNSNQGSDRGRFVNENNKNKLDKSTSQKIFIANIQSHDTNVYGKPWVCVVSRGWNYFTTKDDLPIGEYIGN